MPAGVQAAGLLWARHFNSTPRRSSTSARTRPGRIAGPGRDRRHRVQGRLRARQTSSRKRLADAALGVRPDEEGGRGWWTSPRSRNARARDDLPVLGVPGDVDPPLRLSMHRSDHPPERQTLLLIVVARRSAWPRRTCAPRRRQPSRLLRVRMAMSGLGVHRGLVDRKAAHFARRVHDGARPLTAARQEFQSK